MPLRISLRPFARGGGLLKFMATSLKGCPGANRGNPVTLRPLRSWVAGDPSAGDVSVLCRRDQVCPNGLAERRVVDEHEEVLVALARGLLEGDADLVDAVHHAEGWCLGAAAAVGFEGQARVGGEGVELPRYPKPSFVKVPICMSVLLF
jgi:hypothetical protein